MNAPLENKVLDARSVGINIEGVDLLADVSLDMLPGEVVALVGPNGSGKSTFLKSISGELKLSSGDISFNNRALASWTRQNLAQHMAVLPQQSVLNFPFTGREVVSLARTPHDTGNQVDKRIVEEVLDYLDAEYLGNRFYPRLSGGEQQRIQLARVLAQIWEEADQPRLLLLDEPSSYFDLAHQQMLIELVHELAARNIAVLIVLHDINMAMACADRIAVLSCGRLRAFGKTDEVITTGLLKAVFSVEASFVVDPKTGDRFMALPGAGRSDSSALNTKEKRVRE